jgi:hypothetical protein
MDPILPALGYSTHPNCDEDDRGNFRGGAPDLETAAARARYVPSTRAKPVTAGELDKLRRLHTEGLNCRQIARELGRAPVTVSRHAAAMGITFDRSKTKEATAARVADLAALRAETSARFLAEARPHGRRRNGLRQAHSAGPARRHQRQRLQRG